MYFIVMQQNILQVDISSHTVGGGRTLSGRVKYNLVTIGGLGDKMVRWLRARKFLPPTRVGDHATVGFKVGRRTWSAEGKDFLAAYHELHREVVG
jgi:hypothetical protein